MGEIFIGGVCAYPYTRYKDPELVSFRLSKRLASADPNDRWSDPRNWPQGALDEWSDDQGRKAASAHREALIAGFRAVRQELDRFRPDAVLIFNHESFENLKEDLLPAFCLYGAPSHRVDPNYVLAGKLLGESEWDGTDTEVWDVPGNTAVSRHLAAHLYDEGFDVAIAYKNLHLERLAHTFTDDLTCLDWDRTGWSHPTIPVHLNTDGDRNLPAELKAGDGEAPTDVSIPHPFRIFDLGAALAKIILASPYRVALIGGAAWSHGTTCAKNGFLFPDVEADFRMYQALEDQDFATWRGLSRQQLIDDGQEQLLTWYPSIGALSVVQPPKRYSQFVGAHLFNSNKVFAAYAK